MSEIFELLHGLGQLRLRAGKEDAPLHEGLHDAEDIGGVVQGHRPDPAVAVGVHHGAGPEVGEGLLEDHTFAAAVQDVDALHPAGAGAARALQDFQVRLPSGVGGKELVQVRQAEVGKAPAGRHRHRLRPFLRL